ncbi:Uncharacterised protein [Mycobacteroides abscessus subsp. abscessus]|nr:Uncharacterised protein [Mycobacteroides abscessus subsp. abscessus]
MIFGNVGAVADGRSGTAIHELYRGHREHIARYHASGGRRRDCLGVLRFEIDIYEVRLAAGRGSHVVDLADEHTVVLDIRLLRQAVTDVRQIGDYTHVVIKSPGRLQQHGTGECDDGHEGDDSERQQLVTGRTTPVHLEGIRHLATQPGAGVHAPQRHGQQHVDHHDDGDGRPHGVPGRDADTLGTATGVKAVVALDR